MPYEHCAQVSLRDLRLVEQCEGQLKTLRADGKIPADAADAIAAIVATGKKGDWEPAQSKLARFMEGQRR